jgi:hypothetical protein
MYSHASQNLKVPAGKNSRHPIRKKPARKRARVIETNAMRERGLGFIRRSLGAHNLAAASATPPNMFFHRTSLHKKAKWAIMKKGPAKAPSFLPPTRKILGAAIRKDKKRPFSSLNYFVLVPISFAQRASRSSSPCADFSHSLANGHAAIIFQSFWGSIT